MRSPEEAQRIPGSRQRESLTRIALRFIRATWIYVLRTLAFTEIDVSRMPQ